MKLLPELIIKEVLRCHAHALLQGFNLQLRIPGFNDTGRGHALGALHIRLAEEELPAEVRDLDAVHVSDNQLGACCGTGAHECQTLEVLAAECPTANKENPLLLNGCHDLLAYHSGLECVARACTHKCSPGTLTPVGSYEARVMVVEPLLNGSELTRLLDDLLGNGPSQESAEASQLRPEEKAEVLELLLDLLKILGGLAARESPLHFLQPAGALEGFALLAHSHRHAHEGVRVSNISESHPSALGIEEPQSSLQSNVHPTALASMPRLLVQHLRVRSVHQCPFQGLVLLWNGRLHGVDQAARTVTCPLLQHHAVLEDQTEPVEESDLTLLELPFASLSFEFSLPVLMLLGKIG
mmetsp:Transcript_55831/g.120693  ORF Transcript_55831/g.120693 Transcript_55831/m.120693 type:complete len:354 (+) Transcript_55831:1861-2922(+)